MERSGLSRRQFTTGVAAVAATAGLGRTAAAEASKAKAAHRGRKPNVLCIIADDLGSADLGSFGHPEIATPHLDRLAKQGVRLERAYSAGSVCSPTRVGWATGRYPGRHPAGLPEPIEAQHIAKVGLGESDPTLPRYLKGAGYRTALFGKWHLGYPSVPGNPHPDYSPIVAGFDEYWGVLDGGCDYFTHNAFAPNPGDFKLWQGTPETDAPGHVEPTDEPGYMTDLTGDKAVDFLQRQDGSQPFYLGVHFTAPHWPWEDRDDQAEAARINDPAVWNGGNSLFHFDGGSLDTYYEMVRIMDENIGRILQALKNGGFADDTLVIFTSDNGGERFSYNWPHTGNKNGLGEGGIRVPGIMRWPGRIKPGSTSDQVLTTMDITASILACAGVTPTTPLDGRDVLGIIAGKEDEVPRKLFWRHRGYVATRPEPNAAVRDGNLKYLRTPAGAESLFDVEVDPREQANLARRRPADLARLRADWEAWNTELLPYPPLAPPPAAP
jgi:arylsulfatase A-like enzyme